MATVAVCEDDRALRELLRRALEGDGYSVVATETGAELLAQLVPAAHAVVLDIGLPDADGRDVCLALRAHGVHGPVLILTALGGVHHKVSGFEAGADDYLTKPFDVPELLVRIRALLRRTTVAVTVDEVQLDATSDAPNPPRPSPGACRQQNHCPSFVAGSVATRNGSTQRCGHAEILRGRGARIASSLRSSLTFITALAFPLSQFPQMRHVFYAPPFATVPARGRLGHRSPAISLPAAPAGRPGAHLSTMSGVDRAGLDRPQSDGVPSGRGSSAAGKAEEDRERSRVPRQSDSGRVSISALCRSCSPSADMYTARAD
ncbi:response regulator transcription factor [Kribbella capetownensis]|uniref:Response regulator transcription factor n=2 Tax=Kribbella capetownensis TaxID=1572659 RepID=A0A4R0JX69_9ACTN|nr:response regulator transcription factor [Kribbella capetownensis]